MEIITNPKQVKGSPAYEIEHDWTISKLLITNIYPKLFMMRAGQYGIYVQAIRPIKFSIPQDGNCQWFFGKPSIAHIATVRSQGKEPVLEFLQECPEFQIARVFKSGIKFTEFEESIEMEINDKVLTTNIGGIRGFFSEIAMNMMGLRPGSTFRISSSNHTDLRDIAYECAVYLNREEKMGCKFDHDKYDYELVIRKYKRENGKIAIVTILHGWDMPNYWIPWKGLVTDTHSPLHDV